ncbi:hypothetical protein RV10_GL003876 [Enterococcus pallens]|nr:hypothetical protein RV10_GL003876 [Enterococcus pallens]
MKELIQSATGSNQLSNILMNIKISSSEYQDVLKLQSFTDSMTLLLNILFK